MRMDCRVGALLVTFLMAGMSQEIHAQVNLVQSAAHDNGAGSLSTCTASFGSANTAGNLIVVAVEIGATATDRQAMITDTQGNTYVPATSQVTWRTVGGGSSAQIFYAANIKGGANTVTMTLAGGATAWNQIEIHEYSGLSTTSPLDVTASAFGTTGTSPFTASSGSAVTTAVSAAQINLTWNASSDPDSAVAGYKIYRNGTQVGTTANTSYQDSGLSASTSYSYTVAAYDPSGNTSAQSASASATTQAADTTPPCVPTGLA